MHVDPFHLAIVLSTEFISFTDVMHLVSTKLADDRPDHFFHSVLLFKRLIVRNFV